MSRNVKYTDVSLKNHKRLENEKALNQRVHVLFGTTRRSRLNRPEYGHVFEKYLFSPTNQVDAVMLKAEAAYVLSQEPTIKIQEGSEVIIVDGQTYELRLNLYSTELNSSFQYIQELKVKS